MEKIVFEYEGMEYQVPLEAYVLDRIVLPNKKVLDVKGWSEEYPPKPLQLVVHRHILFLLTPETIGQHLNAAVALEVDSA